MIPFHIVFSAVLALTVLSGGAATAIALWGEPRANWMQRRLVDKLSQIALLGAGAIIALLAGASVQ